MRDVTINKWRKTMGLAASQARFLGITARKSNIEYEGQQVNQQRTALAEEVNALYTQLLSVKVPIAPDATDYYEADYAFTASNTSGMDGDYLIKSYFQNNDGTYYLNTERTYQKNVAVGTVNNRSSIVQDEETGDMIYTSSDGTKYTLNKSTNSTMVSLINDTYNPVPKLSDDEEFYYYTSKSKDDEGITYYTPISKLNEGDTFSMYKQANTTKTDVVSFPSAELTFDANNRVSSISKLKDSSGTDILNGGSVDVNTKKVYNTEEYDAALRDYTMSKEEYDKKIADLNAKTKALQQEDKVLEMRLDQIDTQQNELQTELEAVKAVLDKNIENTFKTFA